MKVENYAIKILESRVGVEPTSPVWRSVPPSELSEHHEIHIAKFLYLTINHMA